MTAPPELPKKDRSLLRRQVLRLIWLERQYMEKLKHSKWLRRIAHSHLFSFDRHPVCRGFAIGMFWAFIPMPFQMLPALLFCWLGFANLPIAIACVWISNPFTYLPIFYVEYQIGMLLQTGDPTTLRELSFNEFSDRYQQVGGALVDFYVLILQGGIFVSSLMAVIGYGLGFPVSAYIRRTNIRRRKKRDAHAH